MVTRPRRAIPRRRDDTTIGVRGSTAGGSSNAAGGCFHSPPGRERRGQDGRTGVVVGSDADRGDSAKRPERLRVAEEGAAVLPDALAGRVTDGCRDGLPGRVRRKMPWQESNSPADRAFLALRRHGGRHRASASVLVQALERLRAVPKPSLSVVFGRTRTRVDKTITLVRRSLQPAVFILAVVDLETSVGQPYLLVV